MSKLVLYCLALAAGLVGLLIGIPQLFIAGYFMGFGIGCLIWGDIK